MDADVILDPSLGSAVTAAQGSDIEFGTHTASVRYDGDKGNGGQQTWREVKLAHGNAVISNVLVSQGYSMGTDVSALVKTVTFNGKCFKFDVAPADGDKGDKGDKGDQGSTGATGSQGATGAQARVPTVLLVPTVSTVSTAPAVLMASMVPRARTARRWSFIRASSARS